MTTITTSLSVATPHSGSHRSFPRCLSLNFPIQKPQRQQISLTHHCRPCLFSSSPQSTNYFPGGGNFGGGDFGGGNFGGSNGGSGGDGSEFDNNREVFVFRRDDFDRFVADVKKTVIENNKKSAREEELLFCINLGIFGVPLIVMLASELVDVKKGLYRDKNCKQAKSELG